jgi:hypothetical protein
MESCPRREWSGCVGRKERDLNKGTGCAQGRGEVGAIPSEESISSLLVYLWQVRGYFHHLRFVSCEGVRGRLLTSGAIW